MDFDDEQIWEWYLKATKEYPHNQYDLSSKKHEFINNKLADLFAGKISDTRPLAEFQRIVSAFNDPDTDNDMPWLMAEWLEAETVNIPFLSLSVITDFQPPSITDFPRGCGATYKNAVQRLLGFECAFVTVRLEANQSPATSTQDLFGVKADALATNNPSIVPPHTHPHIHTGDELILVRKGNVSALLDNTGAFVDLTEGDYIHFTAEIPHSLWNVWREPAEVLIIRFFQLDRQGTRVTQLEALDKIFNGMTKLKSMYKIAEDNPEALKLLSHEQGKSALRTAGKKLLDLWQDVEAWVHDRTRPPYDRLRDSGRQPRRRVLDSVGLMSFLKNYLGQEYPSSVYITSITDGDRATAERSSAALANASTADTVWCKPTFSIEQLTDGLDEADQTRVRQFFHGIASSADAKHDLKLLGGLAEKLNLPPVLLDGYLAPAALRVAVVRGGKRFDCRKDDPSSRPLGFEYVAHRRDDDPSKAKKAKYWIPSRALASSDLSLTLLDLEVAPGGATPQSAWNQHPGFEVLIPLEGAVTVAFEGRGDLAVTPENCGIDRLLIYRSSWPHRVSLSEGYSAARVLVIRFNIIDPLAKSCFAETSADLELVSAGRPDAEQEKTISGLAPSDGTAELGGETTAFFDEMNEIVRRVVEQTLSSWAPRNQKHKMLSLLYKQFLADSEKDPLYRGWVTYEAIQKELWPEKLGVISDARIQQLKGEIESLMMQSQSKPVRVQIEPGSRGDGFERHYRLTYNGVATPADKGA